MKAWQCTFTLLALALAGCADPSRSRNTADPQVPALALAQQVCSNCHGMTGVSISPTFPNLAAQTPAYLLAQLQGFKSHAREDPAGVDSMWGLSRSLGEDQMRGLAAYYAAQPPAPPLPPPRVSGLPDRLPATRCDGACAPGSLVIVRVSGLKPDVWLALLVLPCKRNRPTLPPYFAR